MIFLTFNLTILNIFNRIFTLNLNFTYISNVQDFLISNVIFFCNFAKK